ncbi:MAG: Rieske 2Fe-2S domain-containing protein [Mycobacterium sp.]|nr:Rieske 2Fe-2S domain-containing protein [Mycobacterium sp.]
MSLMSRLAERIPKDVPLQIIPKIDWARQKPTYQQAEPAVIDAALRRALGRPSGNWYVFGASADVRADRPFGSKVAGAELVAWRDEQKNLHVGPASCPHLGADLSTGKVDCGGLICPWHGLRLDGGREFGWKPLPAYDDGVLVWVRLDRIGGEQPTDAPVLPVRPVGPMLAAVARLEGVCEPRDIISNRLDPWHGAWFHPYSFTQLEVLNAPPVDADEEADRFQVAVTFKMGRLGVPVIAEFTVPEPRTIVMHIVDGEGAGSVVETHATPIGDGSDGRPRTAVIEAVIATSDRTGFQHSLRVAPLIQPLMKIAAGRLWRDDLVYAERRYALRASKDR